MDEPWKINEQYANKFFEFPKYMRYILFRVKVQSYVFSAPFSQEQNFVTFIFKCIKLFDH